MRRSDFRGRWSATLKNRVLSNKTQRWTAQKTGAVDSYILKEAVPPPPPPPPWDANTPLTQKQCYCNVVFLCVFFEQRSLPTRDDARSPPTSGTREPRPARPLAVDPDPGSPSWPRSLRPGVPPCAAVSGTKWDAQRTRMLVCPAHKSVLLKNVAQCGEMDVQHFLCQFRKSCKTEPTLCVKCRPTSVRDLCVSHEEFFEIRICLGESDSIQSLISCKNNTFSLCADFYNRFKCSS